VDRLGELARELEVRLAGLAPDQVGVRRVGQAAADRLVEAVAGLVEALDGALAGENGLSLSSTSEVSRSAASASVRASSSVGTPITSAARRAATSFSTASRVGTSTLPPMWPHFLTAASWSSKCTPAAPASIIAFISSKAFSTPPKPASASATIGAK
jgi:hypothetical protein